MGKSECGMGKLECGMGNAEVGDKKVKKLKAQSLKRSSSETVLQLNQIFRTRAFGINNNFNR
jgi:hypothetical protein